MLVDLPRPSTETLADRLREARARVRQFHETHPDEDLFGASRPLRRAVLRLALTALDLALWIAFVVLLRSDAGPVPTLAVLAAALGVLALDRLVARVLRRRTERHAAAARVGLGALIQANRDLWSRSNRAPRFGALVVTTDPELERDPAALQALAVRIQDLAKGEDEREPAPEPLREPGAEPLREIVEHVRSEVVRIARLPVPAEIAGNERTWVLDVLFFPADLPRGFVDRRFWPVLVHAEDARIAPLVLPRELWWSAATDELWTGDHVPTAAPFQEPRDFGLVARAAAPSESEHASERAGDLAADGSRAEAAAPALLAPSATAPAVSCGTRRPLVLAGQAAGAGIGLLVVLLLLLAVLPSGSQQRPMAIFLAVAGAWALGALALSLLALRTRLEATGAELVHRGLFTTTRVPWHAVTAVAHDGRVLRAHARRKERDVRFTARGRSADRRALADAIVARAPRLAGLAWATGLRAARPAAREAPLPERVHEELDVLTVEGPGPSRLVLDPRHERHAEARAALETRLLPLLLTAEPAPEPLDLARERSRT